MKIISLPRSVERRQAISAELSALGVAYDFISAVDGRELPSAAPSRNSLFDRDLSPGEYGCAASHMLALAIIAAGPDEFACVLEDDAEVKPGIRDFLDADRLRRLPHFHVLRLVSDPHRWRFPAWSVSDCTAPHGVVAMARPGWGCQGQIWTREGARYVLDRVKGIRAPADNMLYHDCHAVGLRVLEVRPGVIAHDLQFAEGPSAASEIGDRTALDRRPKGLRSRAARRAIRWRRKGLAAASFAKAWGMSGIITLLVSAPPWKYFR